ncbi:MAG: hypothetical protein DRI30_07755, partial [Chloroflexi bacterium]
IKRNAEFFVSGIGDARVIWNQDELNFCIKHFQSKCTSYLSDLLNGDPSHIKILGHLLYSLTQLERTDRRSEGIISVGLQGLVFHRERVQNPEKAKEFAKIIEICANETLMFMAVYFEFCNVQRSRDVQKRFDLNQAPMHQRYLRAMIEYLRPNSNEKLGYLKTSFDFYLIFKSMDLYGVDTPYLD